MSDPEGPKEKGIPSWQRQVAPDSTVLPKDESQDQSRQASPDSRASLIEKAANFLEDDDIRNAPIERKQYFLQSKGLTEAEIDDLLQIQHASEAEVTEDFKKEQDNQPSNPAQTSSEIMSSGEKTPAAPLKDMPPIITYPEFLIHSQKPPPLITARRLLAALYLASGTAATIYGASKYLVEPMVESLSLARHSLFETASTNLDTLNEKLEAAVSKIPDIPLNPDNQGDADIESISSDPARFFNRSAATQTSPGLSRSNSSASASEPLSPTSPTTGHAHTLSTINSLLADLRSSDNLKTSPVKDSIDDLRLYLDGLRFENSMQLGGRGGEKGKADEVSKVKAEIRGVKGVLLSARNFPSSASVR
ncbi:hypothetical protein MMC28_003928 [Mycoblastus sanguinarius]|nr:hypothetical protein [Mycoblastus sanguinarius]